MKAPLATLAAGGNSLKVRILVKRQRLHCAEGWSDTFLPPEPGSKMCFADP